MVKKKTTLKGFAQSGGIARWKGISKKERSKIMKKVRKGKKVSN